MMLTSITVSTVLLSLFLMPKTVSSVEVEFRAEYYSNVTLVCDDKLLALPYTTFKKYWILPNGTTLQWSHEPGNSSRFVVGESPGFNLTITNVDEDDFGYYYCVILWDDYIYLVHSIKIGLNVNGALYEELFNQYRKSAIIGLIAGAATATLLGLFCLLYWCRYSEVNTENDEKPIKSKESDTKGDKSDASSKTDTVYAKENEAIYELDKAVKDYDDDTVVGDGEVAIGLKEDLLGAKHPEEDIEEDGMPMQIFEPVSATLEITQPDVPRFSHDDDGGGDCNGGVPPPPPPPLILPLNESLDDAEEHEHGFINNAFDPEDDGFRQGAVSRTAMKYMYQDDNESYVKGHYADVKF